MKRIKIKKIIVELIVASFLLTLLCPLSETKAEVKEISACQDAKIFKNNKLQYYMDTSDYGDDIDVDYRKSVFNSINKKVPSLVLGDNRVNVDSFLTPSFISNSYKGKLNEYFSYVKFKCTKTGKYKITFSNLEVPDNEAHYISEFIVMDVKKLKKNKYGFGSVKIAENINEKNSKTKYINALKPLIENAKADEDDYYEAYLQKEYSEAESEKYFNKKSTNKIKMTKGTTYYFFIGNAWYSNFTDPYYSQIGLLTEYDPYSGPMSFNIKIEKMM